MIFFFFFFFFFFSSRRRHTRFDCDWSSDVCSSDLVRLLAQHIRSLGGSPPRSSGAWGAFARTIESAAAILGRKEIGRASCRERVEILVGDGIIKKKRNKYNSIKISM